LCPPSSRLHLSLSLSPSQIFPTELWGSKRNMVCLTRAIERFIVLRRHESMSVLEVS
ncbi:unnamed protein product, partial [Hapterophycus canaliculatus]